MCLTACGKGTQNRGVPGQLTLPETNLAPENRPGPKRKVIGTNHRFSGANLLLVSGRLSDLS